MSQHQAPSRIGMQALLESGRAVPRQPDAVRERALARARASAAAPLPLVELTPPTRPRFPRHAVAPAAAAALALGIAGTVYALSGRWSCPEAPVRAVPATTISAQSALSSGSVPTSHAATVPVPASPPAAPASEPKARPASEQPAPPRTRRAGTKQEAYDAELELMRSAHTAYAAHDFGNALVLVGEHARRFPGGLLAEEREALRVRCLVGSGRASEARRAAAAFATRFPRSVLLPRVQAAAKPGAE
jgi:hypothetical protein